MASSYEVSWGIIWVMQIALAAAIPTKIV